MTNSPWTFRAAAIGVAFATAAATFSAFSVAQAAEGNSHTTEAHPQTTGDHDQAHAPAASPERHDPAEHDHREHNLDGPLTRTLEAQREEALKQVISGDATVKNRDGSKVVQLKSKKGDPKYVELGRERTDKVFAILVEFGDETDSRYGGTPGPLHNRIPEPDRTKNNWFPWKADYNREHYEQLYFGTGDGTESMKKYFEKQSSGRYSIEGQVADWVKVRYNEARYGSNKCDTCVWDLVRDGLNAWVADQEAKGKSDAEIKAELAEFDEWDRYDFDGDGDFNEPDGYIDHMQIVHAGADEADGGGAEGEDAIWSHRWYAYSDGWGQTGPEANKLGGTQIGDTGMWAGDYTIQAENVGLAVFAHEYGHDLGLPDHYGTSGGADARNSTGFWTLMSLGALIGESQTETSDLPSDMTAWDKLQLGWLNYDTAKAATKSTHKLGVAEYNTKDKQALVVELPKKAVTTEVVQPAQGATQWWSGSGDQLSNTLTRSMDLTGKSSAALTLDGWWDIEKDYDFLYTEVSTDNGTTWTALDGTANGNPISRDSAGKPALDGTTETHQKLSYPLDAYAGQKIELRFRYQTDQYVAQKGFTADRITVTADGAALVSDDAETADPAWTARGFSRLGSSYVTEYEQYYIAENRQYVSYDRVLKVGPYNHGSAERPDWVERYPYQNGLLIWKWDTSQRDNNTSQHPGVGLLLPVDAHPTALKWSDGTLMSNTIQTFDSPFSLYRTDGITLHKDDVPMEIPSKRGNPVFDDHAHTYYDETNPTGGVRITDTNTRIRILSESFDGSTVRVRVSQAK
ncbi:immune inhibitor A domain-containing protein [Streptomyces ipomoeae]|uniref:immune inhibitor A domain-containing protein n=1 Tax=Streptomyces ipomoeae TaxID=103232 RepID=UPI0011473337|nr:immune inhibitor A domain-containing protein [Streptomyces ipomoeae]MDX2935564.1 immune inhibitor A [Streptomyces ipomoeae]TQE18384.1 M6 family metalloprotease domain-containing protein [Streptomyces ipomoeae]